MGESEHTTVSTKAYDYFITGLSVFDAADRIRETINPVFFDAFREQLDLLDERLQGNVNATWDETFLADLPSDNQRILPTHITDINQCSAFDKIDALYQRMSELKKCARRTLTPADIFYDASIMRGPDSGTVVFKVFSENPAYTQALNTQDWCRDFSYWNNTDRDDNVSEEEWERRAQYWYDMPYKPMSELSVGFTQPPMSTVTITIRRASAEK